MTASEFMERLETLFSAGRYRAALELASASIDHVGPCLSHDQRERMHGMIEVATRIVDIDRAVVSDEATRTA